MPHFLILGKTERSISFVEIWFRGWLNFENSLNLNLEIIIRKDQKHFKKLNIYQGTCSTLKSYVLQRKLLSIRGLNERWNQKFCGWAFFQLAGIKLITFVDATKFSKTAWKILKVNKNKRDIKTGKRKLRKN